MVIGAAQYFASHFTMVLLEQLFAQRPTGFSALTDQLCKLFCAQHDGSQPRRHMLAQDDVLRLARRQVMCPYPFPGYQIKNADGLAPAAFDYLDFSAYIAEGNGIPRIVETNHILLLHLKDFGDGRQFVWNRRQRTQRDFFLWDEGTKNGPDRSALLGHNFVYQETKPHGFYSSYFHQRISS